MSDIVSALENCARCGGKHSDVEFKPFGQPVITTEEIYTHWARCPTTGEPILMFMRQRMVTIATLDTRDMG